MARYEDFLNPHSGRIAHLKLGQGRYKQAIDEGWQRVPKNIQSQIRKDIESGVDTKEPDYLHNLETRIRTHPYQLTYGGETTYYRTEAERQRYADTLKRFSVTSPVEGAVTRYGTKQAAERYAASLPKWYTEQDGKKSFFQTERAARMSQVPGRLERLGEIASAFSVITTQDEDPRYFESAASISLSEAVSLGYISEKEAHRRRETGFTQAYREWQRSPERHRQIETSFSEYYSKVQEAAGGRETHFDTETGGYFWFEEEPIKDTRIPGPWLGPKPGSIGAELRDILRPPVVQALGSLESFLGFPSAWLRAQEEPLWAKEVEAAGKGELESALVFSTGARMSGVGASAYDFLTFPVRPSMWIGAGALASGLVLSPKVRGEVKKEIMKDPLQFGLEIVGGYVGATALAPLVVKGGRALASKSYQGLTTLKGKAVSVKDVFVTGLREDFSWFNEVVSYSRISPEFVKPQAFDPSTAYFSSWDKALARIRQTEVLQVFKIQPDFISPQAYSPGVPSGLLGEFRQVLKISPEFIKPLPFEASQVYAFWQYLKIHPDFILPKAWAPKGPSGAWGSFKQVLKISTEFTTPAYRTIEQTSWGKFVAEVKAYGKLGTGFKASGPRGVSRVLDVSKSMKTILEQTSKAGTGKASSYALGLPNLSQIMEAPQTEKYKTKKTTYTALAPPSILYKEIKVESVVSFPGVYEIAPWSKRGSQWAQLESPYYKRMEKEKKRILTSPSSLLKFDVSQLTSTKTSLKELNIGKVGITLGDALRFDIGQTVTQTQKQKQKQEPGITFGDVTQMDLKEVPFRLVVEEKKKRKRGRDPLSGLGELRLRPVKFRSLKDVLRFDPEPRKRKTKKKKPRKKG